MAAGTNQSVEAIMAKHGSMPLPPYIARVADAQDFIDYQTIYAREAGAVAAPTAGLRFTPELFERLEASGVHSASVTLHVGAGTFLPVKTEKIDDHPLHAEQCEISEEAAGIINERRSKGGRIVAVGTTSLRLLETAVREDGSISRYRGNTRLFIKPGQPLSKREPPSDEFPFAKVDPFHACVRILRGGAHEKSLCSRSFSRVPVLFLWRRLSASPRGERNGVDLVLFLPALGARQGRAPGGDFNAPGNNPHAGFHACRHSSVCQSRFS